MPRYSPKPSREPPHLAISPEAMPAALREFARVLGDNDCLRLVGGYNGARVVVPKLAHQHHVLRMVLGPEGFERLVAEYGGEIIDIPKADGYIRELRHDQVRRCREQGFTVDETALYTGYTRRHVMNIMHDEAGDDVLTLDLFDEAPKSFAGRANDPFGLGSR